MESFSFLFLVVRGGEALVGLQDGVCCCIVGDFSWMEHLNTFILDWPLMRESQGALNIFVDLESRIFISNWYCYKS